MLVVHRANPSFPHVFRFSRRRLESVCVCVCVCVCVFLFRIRIFLDFPRLFTLLFALIFRRLRSYPYHSAAPLPDFLHLHYGYVSTRTRHPPALCDNLISDFNCR